MKVKISVKAKVSDLKFKFLCESCTVVETADLYSIHESGWPICGDCGEEMLLDDTIDISITDEE